MKVAFYLKRPDAQTPTAVYARISYRTNQLKLYTEESILPKFWNKETHRAKETQKFREYPEFNARLDKIEATIKSTFRRYQNDHSHEIPSTTELKELLEKEFKTDAKKTVAESLFGFFEHFIEQTGSGVRLHPKTGKPYANGSIKVYRTAQKHMLNFQTYSRKRVDFDTIDNNFYHHFVEYLIKIKKLSTNAIGKNLQVVKLIMNEATERGLNKNMAFKSKRFAVVSEKSESIYLTEKEVLEISNLDLSQNERLDKVRDLFIIGCHTGLRYSDFSILSPSHIKDGFIEIVQSKTGDPVTIPLHQSVERILEKYKGKLPRSISNQKTNGYLKEIGQKAPSLNEEVQKSMTKGGERLTKSYKKWELLSTHTARRSFATIEYLNGTPSITIMAITGHKTEKSFLKYIKASPNDHARKMKGLWEERYKLKAV